MTQTVQEGLGQLIRGVLFLKTEAFQAIEQIHQGWLIALIVVLLAGLSQGIAQSIVLFINRVRPVRFILSLLIGAILFFFGYIFLVLSTWAIILLPFTVDASLITIVQILGFSYIPLIFSFLSALPYLGNPLISLLSMWHLLTMVVGVASIMHLDLGSALGYVSLGWTVWQIAQQTIGLPLANVGRWIANKIAGVQLATSTQELLNIVQTGLHSSSTPLTAASTSAVGEVFTAHQFIGSNADKGNLTSRLSTGSIFPQSLPNKGSSAELVPHPNNDRQLKTILGLLGMGLLAFLVVALLNFLATGWLEWVQQLPVEFKFTFELFWIGVLALVIAGLQAPLETLGWWAGWYNDELDTQVNVGELAEPVTNPSSISRYLIYLDGISQSTFKYLPDIELFLQRLTEILPDGVALIRGIMPYSVLNNPLDEDRPLALFWQLADRLRLKNPASIWGMIVNLRNVLTVAVSSDQRYGPLYNQGIAQVMYNSLLKHGYQLGSGVPITLIGYSGGGQMAAASAPFLKRSLQAPIEIISLGGVISGNCNILKLEHLYHLVGDKDFIERVGPVMFPGRWQIFPLSYWNRAKRRGKISRISLGLVGHQVPGGLLDSDCYLPDGRSHLQQTLDLVAEILDGNPTLPETQIEVKPSNYSLYQKAAFNRPDFYPIVQSLPSQWYRPMGTWMGRLILPKSQERTQVKGVFFEVYHADPAYSHLVEQVVNLRFCPTVAYVRSVTKDVHFSDEAAYTSQYGGLIHPTRLNHWRQVNPLESLAGSHPDDDVIIMLPSSVEVEGTSLYISEQPIQITGRFYALIRFISPIGDEDEYQVIHFNPLSRKFDGLTETVRLPEVVADQNGVFPSTKKGIEHSPINETGWYIYGAQDKSGKFVVQSVAPCALLRLQPDKVLFGYQAGWDYIRHQTWANLKQKKGNIESVLLTSQKSQDEQVAIAQWKEGDYALLIHVYGGIGGAKAEPEAKSPIFFGHFAYGIAQVVREPLASELRFEICYYQVYTHNTDGIIAGALHWSRYLGDRQFGWLGTRPTANILIKFPPFTADVTVKGLKTSALRAMIQQLEAMTARYRIGDGTGATYVGPANNCSQDSNQALFVSIQQFQKFMENKENWLENWLENHPEYQAPFDELLNLEKALERELQPFGRPRQDWEKNLYNLGSTLEDEPLRNLYMGLGSWRTMFPRLASDAIVKIFLKQGACIWVLRTNQVGGFDPNIEPVAPNTF